MMLSRAILSRMVLARSVASSAQAAVHQHQHQATPTYTYVPPGCSLNEPHYVARDPAHPTKDDQADAAAEVSAAGQAAKYEAMNLRQEAARRRNKLQPHDDNSTYTYLPSGCSMSEPSYVPDPVVTADPADAATVDKK